MPDPKVIQYFEELEASITGKGGSIKLLAGNHEHEIWQQISDGETFGLSGELVSTLRELVESLDLFHVDGPFLFMHSYPTVEFLRALLHYKNVVGRNLNGFNNDHYKKAFRSTEALNQYCYTRSKRKDSDLLYEPANIESYYRKNGSEIATLLTALEIDCIIHGHKPQRSGTQADYEFQKWLPDIRIIGNDTKVSQLGIGATIVRMDLGRAPEILFINPANANKKNRNKVKHLLRGSAPISSVFQTQSEEILHFRKLQKRLEELSQEHNNQITQLKSGLERQETSNLLLKEELAGQGDELLKARTELDTHQSERHDLATEIMQAISPADKDTQTTNDEHPPDQENDALLPTILQLKQKTGEHSQARKRAVGYLRACHNKTLELEAQLERYRNDSSEAETFQSLTLDEEIARRRKAERSGYIWRIYAIVVSIMLVLIVLTFLQ